MSAIAASARVLRSSSNAIHAGVRRSYSSAASQPGSSTVTQGHSDKKLFIVSGVSAVVGFDVCYAYYNWGPGSKAPVTSTA